MMDAKPGVVVNNNNNGNSETSTSKLYHLTNLDQKDPVDCLLEDSYTKLQSLINLQLADTVLHNDLVQYAEKSKQHSDELSNSLLYLILIDSSMKDRYLRYLLLCNNNAPLLAGQQHQQQQQQQLQPDNTSSYGILITNLVNISLDSYNKLQDQPKQQFMWLIRELTKARFINIEKVLYNMLRNIQGGNLSDKNLMLCDGLLGIFQDNIDWLYANVELLQLALYTYLRVLADHHHQSMVQLRQRETDFCIQIMRDRWNDCMQIGRDLIRLLQNLSKIPEFEQLWKDIILQPVQLSQQFASGGLLHILRMPTRRRCIISRLTPDMERKIYFLITNVKFGNHKRYQDWFQRQYFSTPESQTLRVDLIRYICAVVHPTNEQLNAGLTPRWAVIGWLLNTCTNSIECSNIKLALLFDWLFYDARKDNIMLIEPAILIMLNSLRTHINITVMLLDFLCRIVYTYHPQYKDHICVGITNAFRDSIEKRVIPSINVIADCGKLDKDIKTNLQATFPLVFAVGVSTPLQQQQQHQQPMIMEQQQKVMIQQEPLTPQSQSTSIDLNSTDSNSSLPVAQSQACFSDNEDNVDDDNENDDDQDDDDDDDDNGNDGAVDDDDSQDSMIPCSSEKYAQGSSNPTLVINTHNQQQQPQPTTSDYTLLVTKPVKVFINEDISQINVQFHLNQLDENINRILVKMANPDVGEATTTPFDELLTHILKYEKNFEQIYDLAQCLLYYLKTNFSNTLVPNEYLNGCCDYTATTATTTTTTSDNHNNNSTNGNDDIMQDIINKRQIFVIFKYLCQTEPSTNEREVLYRLIKDIYTKQKRISYFFLFYLCVNDDDENVIIYKELVHVLSSFAGEQYDNVRAEQLKYLIADMRLCEQDDADLFCFMLKFVYKNFQSMMTNNATMLRLICGCVDARQLKNLLANIICDDLKLFKQTAMLHACIHDSLQWDTIEQVFFWKLLLAHSNITVSYLLPFVKRLDKNRDCEAICAVFQMLKTSEPTLDIVKCLLNRHEDNMSRALFVFYSKTHGKELIQILAKVSPC
jgi:integrator complex subunit 3